MCCVLKADAMDGIWKSLVDLDPGEPTCNLRVHVRETGRQIGRWDPPSVEKNRRFLMVSLWGTAVVA